MSVVIRLNKTGRKGEGKYRIVVKERQSKRDGKAVEILGWLTKTPTATDKKINLERYKYWVSKGAKATPAVAKILE